MINLKFLKIDKIIADRALECFLSILFSGPPIGMLIICFLNTVENLFTTNSNILSTVIGAPLVFIVLGIFLCWPLGLIPAFISALCASIIVLFKKKLGLIDALVCGTIGGLLFGHAARGYSKILDFISNLFFDFHDPKNLKMMAVGAPHYNAGNVMLGILTAFIIWLWLKHKQHEVVTGVLKPKPASTLPMPPTAI